MSANVHVRPRTKMHVRSSLDLHESRSPALNVDYALASGRREAPHLVDRMGWARGRSARALRPLPTRLLPRMARERDGAAAAELVVARVAHVIHRAFGLLTAVGLAAFHVRPGQVVAAPLASHRHLPMGLLAVRSVQLAPVEVNRPTAILLAPRVTWKVPLREWVAAVGPRLVLAEDAHRRSPALVDRGDGQLLQRHRLCGRR